MIRLTLFLLWCAGATSVEAQDGAFNLQHFRAGQISQQRKGLGVLAAWGGANIIAGGYYSSHTSGSTKYFHQMNMYWGIVNGAIGGSALLRLPAAKKKLISFAETMKEQQKTEKIFLFNAGLDLAYIVSGVALKESSKNNPEKRDRRFGYGNSLLLQGSFLLLFDGLMYTVIHKKGKALNKILEQVNLSVAPNQVSLLVKW